MHFEHAVVDTAALWPRRDHLGARTLAL